MNNRCKRHPLEGTEADVPPPATPDSTPPADAAAGPTNAQIAEPASAVSALPDTPPPIVAPPSESPTEIAEPNPLVHAALSVILLANNEGAELDEAAVAWIELLRGLNRPFEVILIDDGTDDVERIDALAERFPEIRVVHRTTTPGLGASLRDGLALAQHPLVFYTLCNKQYQPADLTTMLEKILEVDVVTGCRVRGVPWWLRLTDVLRHIFCVVLFGLPLERRPTWLGWTACKHRLIARWLFGLRFQDPESTFCLFRREIFRRIPIQSRGDFAPIEILAKANFLVTSGAEVPVTYVPRGQPRPILREAIRVFQEPNFGPAVLPELAPAECVSQAEIEARAPSVVESSQTAGTDPQT